MYKPSKASTRRQVELVAGKFAASVVIASGSVAAYSIAPTLVLSAVIFVALLVIFPVFAAMAASCAACFVVASAAAYLVLIAAALLVILPVFAAMAAS